MVHISWCAYTKHTRRRVCIYGMALHQKFVIKNGVGKVETLLARSILPTLKTWRCIGATPNVLTTLGLVFSTLCVLAIRRGWNATAVLCLALRGYFDYADGLMARTYDLTSQFGCYYDHLVDLLFAIGLVHSIYHYHGDRRWVHIGAIAVFGLGFLLSYCCIEAAYHKPDDKETSISWMRHLCTGTAEQAPLYADNGVWYVVCALVLMRGRACGS